MKNMGFFDIFKKRPALRKVGKDEIESIVASAKTKPLPLMSLLGGDEKYLVERKEYTDKVWEKGTRKITFQVLNEKKDVVSAATLVIKGKKAEIDHVFTVERYKRLGMQGILMSLIEKEAGQKGIKKLRIISPSKDGMKFYKEKGFKRTIVGKKYKTDKSLVKKVKEPAFKRVKKRSERRR